MKSKTTTREYDADGNMTKETVVETDSAPVNYYSTACTCGQQYHFTMPYCPVHGYRSTQPYIAWCSTTGTNTKAIAKSLAAYMA